MENEQPYEDQWRRQFLYQLIDAWTSPGDTIADLCCGTGTASAVACRMGRHSLAVDRLPLSMKYIDKRLGQLKSMINNKKDSDEYGECLLKFYEI